MVNTPKLKHIIFKSDDMLLEGFLGQLLLGLKMTVLVSGAALCLGMFLGLVGALSELSRYVFLRKVVIGINSIIRGLPELLTLFAIYFGGTIALSKMLGGYTEVNAFSAGVVALGVIFAAYAAQILRGAFLAIPKTQGVAAKALGLSAWTTFMRILLPQMWQHALPGLGNVWLTTLKDSALVALIGLPDLMNKTQVAANATHKPFVFYFAAALIYLGLTSCSQIIIKFSQCRFRY